MIWNRLLLSADYIYKANYEMNDIIYQMEQSKPSATALLINTGLGYKIDLGKRFFITPAISFPLLGFGMEYKSYITETTTNQRTSQVTTRRYSNEWWKKKDSEPFIGDLALHTLR